MAEVGTGPLMAPPLRKGRGSRLPLRRPAALQGDGRSVLRPYGLACTYPSQIMVRGRPGCGGAWIAACAAMTDGR